MVLAAPHLQNTFSDFYCWCCMREERVKKHIWEGDGCHRGRQVASVACLNFGPNILYTAINIQHSTACTVAWDQCLFFFYTANQLTGLNHVLFSQLLLKLHGTKVNSWKSIVLRMIQSYLFLFEIMSCTICSGLLNLLWDIHSTLTS